MNTNNSTTLATTSRLPANVPQGAQNFQAAVDGKLTKEIWEQILDAQIKQAKDGDRGAAKFLLEYAGGVASMRGATFVQENHQHDHYHDGPGGAIAGPALTGPVKVNDSPALVDPVDGIPERTHLDFEHDRERRARRASNQISQFRENANPRAGRPRSGSAVIA